MLLIAKNILSSISINHCKNSMPEMLSLEIFVAKVNQLFFISKYMVIRVQIYSPDFLNNC